MVFNFDSFKRKGRSDFSRLGALYVIAISAIAFIIITGQLLIQNYLQDQLDDSRIVNVAGRQRMLSQKISKLVLLLEKSTSSQKRQDIYKKLNETVILWKTSQDGLLYGNDTLHLSGRNSDVVIHMFHDNAAYYQNILIGCKEILTALENDIHVDISTLQDPIETILENEDDFLLGMDAIVFRYDYEARHKVSRLRLTEYVLLVISLGVILFEIVYIFKPTTKSVNKTLFKLIESEKNAQKMAKEIGVLYASLEKSYEKLSTVNQPPDNPRLLAKTDRGGNIKFISDYYLTISGFSKEDIGETFNELIPGAENSEDILDELIDVISEGNSWHQEIKFKNKSQKDIWVELTVTPVFNNQHEITEMLVVGTDLTKRKLAEMQMHQKDRLEIDKKVKEQKFRSVLILEGQEEERKRIAMDIHDGIGQLLTSLKFQIESIDMGNYIESRKKLEDAKNLLKDIIKEVRKVTFNLKPTVLNDYGISSGLAVYTKEINKLTDENITFLNKTNFNKRLPTKIENNIYRITQEAINNAIKYSQSHSISVELSHDMDNMFIQIEDKGIGFEEKILENPDFKIESGNGFFNMFERTEYINGKLEINSSPGNGTVIRLIVPIKEFT